MTNEILKRILSSIILLILTFFCIIKGSYFFYIMLITILVISFIEWHNMTNNKPYYLFGFLYIFFSLFCVYQLRFSFDDDISLFLLVLTICILTDLGGFIFGKTFKGPKLTKLSPKKTYSGVFGSFFLSILIIPSILIFNILNDVSIIKLTIFILIISATSQIGDIFISYFKRISKIKDTGKIIPGHGGLLDRIDGMIFAYPVSYSIFFFNFFTLYK